MTKVVAQNTYLIAVKDYDSIEIRFVPNPYGDFYLSKEYIVKIAKKFMPTIGKKLGLGVRYFKPQLSFNEYEGYVAKDILFIEQLSYTKQDFVMNNIKQVFADIESEISELICEYAEFDLEAQE